MIYKVKLFGNVVKAHLVDQRSDGTFLMRVLEHAPRAVRGTRVIVQPTDVIEQLPAKSKKSS